MSDRRLSCPEAQALADERHDRPLPPGEEDALRRHLGECAACAAAAAGSDRVHAALLGMEAPSPSAVFTDEVVARLDRGPGRRSPADAAPASPRWVRGLTALAGTVAVAALALLVLPLDAAAESVETLVPGAAAPALPPMPPEVASLLAGITDLLPPYAAAAGAAAAVAGLLLQAALLRRRTGGSAG